MKSFALVLLAIGAAATTNAMPNDAPSTMTQDGRVLVQADYSLYPWRGLLGRRKKEDDTTPAPTTTSPPPTTTAPPPPPPTPYSFDVCFKHHSCGLDRKRGERDRGISPIIPALDTKRKCCNGIPGVRAGSAWGRGPRDCQNCNGKK